MRGIGGMVSRESEGSERSYFRSLVPLLPCPFSYCLVNKGNKSQQTKEVSACGLFHFISKAIEGKGEGNSEKMK